MDRFKGMEMFVRIVEVGSFSQVAKEFNTTQPTVSKHISELENSLNTKLLRRSTRSIKLTDTGKQYYDRCQIILREVEEAESVIRQHQNSPTGTVRVTTGVAFGNAHIIPHLNAFFETHPGLHVTLHLTDQNISLIQEGIDLALRMGNLADSSMSAKQVGSSPWVTVASPSHFDKYRVPEHPSEISEHPCVLYSGRTEPKKWRFLDQGKPIQVPVNGKFTTNDALIYRSALLAGLGIGIVPYWLVGDFLKTGALKQVLNEYNDAALPIHAVYPPGRRIPRRVRYFEDFIIERLKRSLANPGPIL